MTTRCLYTAEVLKAVVGFSLSHGVAYAFTQPSPVPDDRINEDSLLVFDDETGPIVLAVADGAGGHPGGADASKAAVRALTTALERSRDGNRRDAILDGFEAANRAVMNLGIGAATTLAVAEVGRDWVRSYHAGDSGVLVTGRLGKLKLVTLSHAPVAYAVVTVHGPSTV